MYLLVIHNMYSQQEPSYSLLCVNYFINHNHSHLQQLITPHHVTASCGDYAEFCKTQWLPILILNSNNTEAFYFIMC